MVSVNMLYTTTGSEFWLVLGVALITLIVGAVVGALAAYKLIPNNAKKQAESIIKDADVKGNQIVKSAQIEGRSAALELKVAAEKEAKEIKDEALDLQKSIVSR